MSIDFEADLDLRIAKAITPGDVQTEAFWSLGDKERRELYRIVSCVLSAIFDWRPIETAPKADKHITYIVGSEDGYLAQTNRRRMAGKFLDIFNNPLNFTPTHWPPMIPLPEVR